MYSDGIHFIYIFMDIYLIKNLFCSLCINYSVCERAIWMIHTESTNFFRKLIKKNDSSSICDLFHYSQISLIKIHSNLVCCSCVKKQARAGGIWHDCHQTCRSTSWSDMFWINKYELQIRFWVFWWGEFSVQSVCSSHIYILHSHLFI